jgi:purine-binding chemotaxis protein CheW
VSWQERWMRPQNAEPDRQFTVFTLGELEYGVDIMHISQIIQPEPIRPIPRAPAYVDGVIERRGVVVPIIDLRRRFGLPSVDVSRATKIIIVRLDRRLVGITVDGVVGVHRVAQSAIRRTPAWIAGPEAEVFTGVCRRGDHLVLLVELATLVSSEENLQLGGLQLDSKRDWSDEAPEAEVVPAGGAGDDVDDWWESD